MTDPKNTLLIKKSVFASRGSREIIRISKTKRNMHLGIYE